MQFVLVALSESQLLMAVVVENTFDAIIVMSDVNRSMAFCDFL